MDIQPLGRSESTYMDLVFYGRSGAGKTYAAATAPSPFIISPDPTGHKSVPYPIPGKIIVTLQDIADILDFFESGEHAKHNIKTLIVDGLSFMFSIFRREIGQYFADFHGAKDPELLPLNAWQKIGSKYEGVLWRFVNLTQGENPVHVIFTTLSETKKDDPEAKYQVRPVFGTQAMNENYPAIFSVISYIEPIGENEEGELIDDRKMLFTEHRGILARDRTGVFPKYALPGLNLSDYLIN